MSKAKELIARNIKHGRDRMGITQEQLAEFTELSTSYIGEIEVGKKYPSAKTLERIGDALGMQMYELYYEAEDSILEVNEDADITTLVAKASELKKNAIVLDRLLRKYLKRNK